MAMTRSCWRGFFVLGVVCVLGVAPGCGGADAEESASAGAGASGGSNGEAGVGEPWDVEEALAIDYQAPPAPADLNQASETIEALRQKYNTTNVPEVLNPPYEPDAVLEYARAIKAFNVARPVDIKWLEGLDIAGLPRGERDNHQIVESAAKSVVGRLNDYFPNEVEFSLKYTNENLQNTLKDSLNMVKGAAEADVSDELKLKNLFARPERVQMIHEFGQDAEKMIPLAEMLDQQFGEGTGDWDTMRQQLAANLKTFNEKVHAAAKMIVPPDDIGDGKLTDIAEEVLGRDDYKIGDWARLIVNAPVKKHNRTLYTIDEHYIHRGQSIWEEFQATTIEKGEDGNFYLWHNDLVKYEQAASQTATGKWILGKRFRGSPILEENIGE